MDPRTATISLQYNGANASGQIGTYLSAFQYKDVASGTSDSLSSELYTFHQMRELYEK